MKLKYKVACAIIVLIVPFFAVLIQNRAREFLTFYALDIGQGDALLFRTPHNRYILIDGGPYTNIVDELSDVLPFFHRTFDLVVLTHPDRDHLDGLLEVVDRYTVKNFLLTGVRKENAFYTALIEKIRQKKIPVTFAKAADDIVIDGLTLDILYPLGLNIGGASDEINATSIIIEASFGDTALLLTGDAPSETEEVLMNTYSDITADILKVGHHGSKTSTSKEFVARVQPSHALISVGKDNTFGHPHPTVLGILRSVDAIIFRTDELGRIACNISMHSFDCGPD
ncbi:MAG: internalization-related competence protein ComEC/Rec2 protein [Candidatus Peregrinibacteria bacterium GW2011_GWA2_47_7]|nr:MAG: internalization-related competence protein ComEC/Rec2 protein [Candidatus Peregrinibacteria bacterium GW2011_GWA2_47_7]